MKEYIVAVPEHLAGDLFRGDPELIRCKDCKHWDGYYCRNKWWGDGYGNYTPPIKKEDGYCDWAESMDALPEPYEVEK